MNRTTRIRGAIEGFIVRHSEIREFYLPFSSMWPPAVDDTTVAAYDGEFFDELADHLHIVDFAVPPEAPLRHPEEVRSWLSENYPVYLAGIWSSDDPSAAS